MTLFFQPLSSFRTFFSNHILGFLAALMVFFPYTGKLAPSLPALIISYVATIPFIWITLKETPPLKEKISVHQAIFLGGILFLIGLIFLSACPSQWHYLFQPSQWLNYQANYFVSKLATIVLGNIPAFISIIGLQLAPSCSKSHHFLNGVLMGILACGLLCVLKFDLHFHLFLCQNPEKYTKFYCNITTPTLCFTGFSPILSTCAAISFLLLLKFYEGRQKTRAILFFCLSVLFLSHLAFSMQRFDFLICALLLSLCASFSFVRTKKWSPFVLLFLLGVLVSFMCVFFFSPPHWDYWNCFFLWRKGVYRERSEILKIYQQNSVQKRSFLSGLLVGKGLASFSLSDPDRKYPHNIFLEIFYEVGSGALIALLLYTFVGLWQSFKQFLKRTPLLSLYPAVTLLIFISHALKSNDLTGIGVYIFVIALVCRSVNTESSLKQPFLPVSYC